MRFDEIRKTVPVAWSSRFGDLDLTNLVEPISELDEFVGTTVTGGSSALPEVGWYLSRVADAAHRTGRQDFVQVLLRWIFEPPDKAPRLVRSFAVWLLVQAGFFEHTKLLLCEWCKSAEGRKEIENVALGNFLGPQVSMGYMSFDEKFQREWAEAFPGQPWDDDGSRVARAQEAVSAFVLRLTNKHGPGWKLAKGEVGTA